MAGTSDDSAIEPAEGRTPDVRALQGATPEVRVLTKRWQEPESWTLDVRAHRGYRALRQALDTDPDA